MKLLILLTIISTFLVSSEPATKDDIKLLIHQMDKRFEAMQIQMDKRFEQVDKRFEAIQVQMDKRFDKVDEKFNTITNMMLIGLLSIVGLIMWDRRTMIKSTKEEITIDMMEKLAQKADKISIEKIASIIEKLVEDNPKAKEIFKKHNLLFQS